MGYSKHFVPLESDPDVFTEFMQNLGTSQSLKFVDVWSLEDELLAIIPRPVQALILILPPCAAHERASANFPIEHPDGEVVWFKQTIHNACGLYAILHAICNNPDAIEPESSLDRLVKLGHTERTKYLENSEKIEDAHARAARSGSSKAPAAEDEVEHHYICFVKHSGCLYQLDGDLDGPVNRGNLEGEDVLAKSALEVIREYTESQKDGMFGLLALVKD